MATVNIYLTFNGNCEEAFHFYQSVFGGEFPYVGRFGEMPDDEEKKISKKEANRIMHISLPINKETILMGSDTGGEWASGFKQGNNFSISVHCDAKEEAERIFNGLAQGGMVTMPLNVTFWGAYFGMLVDQFGIQWRVNVDLNSNL